MTGSLLGGLYDDIQNSAIRDQERQLRKFREEMLWKIDFGNSQKEVMPIATEPEPNKALLLLDDA
jgi:hypothetical protein